MKRRLFEHLSSDEVCQEYIFQSPTKRLKRLKISSVSALTKSLERLHLNVCENFPVNTSHAMDVDVGPTSTNTCDLMSKKREVTIARHDRHWDEYEAWMGRTMLGRQDLSLWPTIPDSRFPRSKKWRAVWEEEMRQYWIQEYSRVLEELLDRDS